MQSQSHRQSVVFSRQAACQHVLGRWCSNLLLVFALAAVCWHEYGPVRYDPPSPATAGEWVLAPDGRTVVFTAPRVQPSGLYTLDLQTKLVRQLALSSAPSGPPRVSRDGSVVAIRLLDRDGRMGIWLESLHGTPGRWRCLDGDRWIRGYDWSADGRTLYVSDVPRRRVRRGERAARFVAYNVGPAQRRIIAITRTDPVFLRTERMAADEEHVLVDGLAGLGEPGQTVYELDPRAGTTRPATIRPDWFRTRTPDGKRILHPQAELGRSAPDWWITDEHGQTVVGPFPKVHVDWDDYQLRADGRSVLVERAASPEESTPAPTSSASRATYVADGSAQANRHVVELLHSDGSSEPMFDDRLLDDPLAWKLPGAHR